MSEVMPQQAPTPAKRYRPRAPNWLLLGGILGSLGYLVITGSACFESLAAFLAVGIVGVAWAIIAARKKWSRGVTFLMGLLALATATTLCGFLGRVLAGGIVFRAAFAQSATSADQFVETRRFGFGDNTALLILKTSKTRLDSLLNAAAFKRYTEAEDWLKDDPSLSSRERETRFRHDVSMMDLFALPFRPNLKVYQRIEKFADIGTPKYEVHVAWDPDQNLAYVYIAYY